MTMHQARKLEPPPEISEEDNSQIPGSEREVENAITPMTTRVNPKVVRRQKTDSSSDDSGQEEDFKKRSDKRVNAEQVVKPDSKKRGKGKQEEESEDVPERIVGRKDKGKGKADAPKAKARQRTVEREDTLELSDGKAGARNAKGKARQAVEIEQSSEPEKEMPKKKRKLLPHSNTETFQWNTIPVLTQFS